MGAAALALSLCLSPTVRAEDSAEQLKSVEKKIHDAEGEVKSITTETDSVLGEVERIDRSIAGHERRLRQLGAEIRAVAARKLAAERRVAELDRELPHLRQRFAARARGLHRLARRGLAPVLLQAPRDWSESQRSHRALEAVLAYDHEVVVDLRRNRAEADAARQETASQATLLDARRRENEREVGALRAEHGDKQKLLVSLRVEKEKHARWIEELKASAEKLRELIEFEAASKAAPFEPPVGAQADMVAPLGALGAVAPSRNGVEIRAAAGSFVRAVKAGRVVFSGWFSGYGKMLILDHGDHLYSVYAYADGLVVASGKEVDAGETIATVGSTGPVASPSLYFEIRDHGAPRDPGTYIRALARK